MRIEVLDHGYVEFIEAWGHGSEGLQPGGYIDPANPNKDYERGIIEAARQSTQGSFRGWDAHPCDCEAGVAPHGPVFENGKPVDHLSYCASVKNPGDQRLLNFLYNNNHATPFEFAGMVIEVQAPIMVFREWQRHRTQSYNEQSARYTALPDLYYYPTVDRMMIDGGKNKQAQGIVPLQRGDAEGAQHAIAEAYSDAERIYQHLLRKGLPRELARLVMPVGHYSKMRASANLRNWLAFMTLRCDPRAQWEIQQYAHAVAQIVRSTFPRTFDAWVTSGDR